MCDEYKRYLQEYTRKYNRQAEIYGYEKITEEEAEEHVVVREARKYYEEINQQKKNYCLYCKYSSTIGSSGSKGNVNEFNGVICDYIGKTGKRRGCSPIGCVKFERRKGRK